MVLDGILVENFKSYGERTRIPVLNLSVLMGANSSGKSTALQTLLAIKQTVECNSADIDLLLSGKYVTLGAYNEVINDLKKDHFALGISVVGDKYTEDYSNNKVDIVWNFRNCEKKDVTLDEIAFDFSSYTMKLKKNYSDRYDIEINNKRTALSIGINNMLFKSLYVNYNKEFNDLFYTFLSDLLKCLFTEKKQGNLERNEFVSIKTVENFYFELMRRTIGKSSQKLDDEYRKKTMDLANRLNSVIQKYCMKQFDYYLNFVNMPSNFKETLCFNCLYRNENIEKLEELLTKYENMLLQEINTTNINKYDSVDELHIDRVYNLGSEEKGVNSECDVISDAFRIYESVVESLVKKIFYLGPIREKPQGLYNVGFETIPKYVGTTGAYFASVLLREDKNREYILPKGEKEKMSLLEALDEWASHLSVASEIHVEKRNSFGFSVSVSNTQRKKSDIMNVGIGTSQVLPVLITGLLSEENEYLIFEQPELHLHPYSQSRLADFFVELVKNGRKVIVETHSEYLVLRLRYQILVNRISENDIVINFFQNRGTTKVEQGKLSGYGNLQYPDDFRDETQKLLDDLMNAALNRRGQ